MNSKKVFVKGLHGCGMRKTNMQKYRDFLNANGHIVVDNPEQSDVILLWTCAFRNDYRENSFSEIQRYLDEFDAELIVAGCLPDIDREKFTEKYKGKFINWRDEDKLIEEYFGAPNKKLSEIQRIHGEQYLCDDVVEFKKENPDKDASFIDHFNKIFVAEGCRFECTYCAERLAFPPYRSFPEEELVEACRRLIEETGKKEIILLGDSLGDYGNDIGTTLPSLIRKLKAMDPEIIIALQGLNPAHVIKYYDEFSGFIKNGDIRHMQLPIQSASDRILQLMKRPYSKAEIEKVFALLNETGFTEVDSHMIIGFPGETDEDYEETMEFILRRRPKYMLVSGFMETPEMDASMLSNKVERDTKLRRLRDAEKRLKAAGILCNTDDSELSADRFRTLNMVQGV